MPNGANEQKIRVIILGGGAAGVSAAFWLSSQAQYDITLYSQGWRLGGKCASGRKLDEGCRIEEHGLHMLMGCYENAFRTVRACYAEWQPPAGSPFTRWDEAFSPQRQVTLMEMDGPGEPPSWATWNFEFPPLPGKPGDAPADQALLLLRRDKVLALRLGDWLQHYLPDHLPGDLIAGYQDALEAFRSTVNPPPIVDTGVAEAKLKQVNQRVTNAILEGRQGLQSKQRSFVLESFSALNRALILANIGLAGAVGIARDVLPLGNRGYDLLNDRDFRQWLQTCGATDAALASAPIRALYDLTFAFPQGDASQISNGALAAGVALRFALEAVLGYKDAPLWRMNAGMGDTIFTPFYQVLEARGVKIRLFSRATELGLADDGSLATVKVAQQATYRNGEYNPFVVVKGLSCWPDQPNWDQLVDGATLRANRVDFESAADATQTGLQTLRSRGDFDVVILAVPPEVIKIIAPDLSARSTSWKNAISSSASVATRALQLWIRLRLGDLGWTLGPTVMTAYREPYDSWADMSHLLPMENWTVAEPPQTIGYFCGTAGPRPGSIRGDADDWLNASIGALWPTALLRNGRFDTRVVVSRYDRANLDPSELYVQTPPGNVSQRLSPTRPMFGNLYVVGDWTLTRFSGGCFESAVESGMLAAAAISGQPADIVGA
jgi:uncharacterized protein with NAD-binding domain and iron-sulfur cluster